jgi:purine nucleosidase
LSFLDDSSRYYFELMEKWHGSRHLTMHDPLAIGAALDPTLIATQRAAVDVEIVGELTRGMTVADWRGLWKRGANAEVAREVDAPRFLGLFFDAMERLAQG